jgi:flagellar motor component MotA
MSNISEMEKQVDILTSVVNGIKLQNTAVEKIRDFMRMSLDQHKDTIDQQAKIWKALAEIGYKGDTDDPDRP